MVRFATLFNVKEQTVTFISGTTYSLAELRAMGMSELLGAMFDFSHKLAALELNADELGLFTAVVLVSAGEDGGTMNTRRSHYCSHHPAVAVRVFNSKLCSSCSSPPDRSGIENVGSVEQLQENLIRALRSLVNKSSLAADSDQLNVDSPRFTKLLLKLADLRTLNNMHSEKLLSFRIDA